MAAFDYRNETFSPSPCVQLVCPICHCVFFNPVECPCQHIFCEDCVDPWLRQHGTCPECRELTLPSSLKRPRVIKNMILSLKVQCQNKSRGCQLFCPLEQYEVHRKTCPYQLIKCSNGNCGLEIMLKDKTKHEDTECVFYLASCTVCRAVIVRHELLDHNCFGELKSELEFTKQQLHVLQDEKSNLQTQFEDLTRKQAEMQEEVVQLLGEVRGRHLTLVQREAAICMLRKNVETMRNMTVALQSLVKFSQGQLSRVSVFLKGNSLGFRLPRSIVH